MTLNTFQACPIEIGSLGYFTDDMVYKWKDVEYEATMGNMLSQYKILTKHKTEMNLTDSRYPNRSMQIISRLLIFDRFQIYPCSKSTSSCRDNKGVYVCRPREDLSCQDDRATYPLYNFLHKQFCISNIKLSQIFSIHDEIIT